MKFGITGASGTIGKKLAEEVGDQLSILSFHSSKYLGQAKSRICYGSLLNSHNCKIIVKHSDCIIHCAWTPNMEENLQILQNLINEIEGDDYRCCLTLLSTIDVIRCGRGIDAAYKQVKLKMEQIVMANKYLNFRIVRVPEVLRPDGTELSCHAQRLSGRLGSLYRLLYANINRKLNYININEVASLIKIISRCEKLENQLVNIELPVTYRSYKTLAIIVSNVLNYSDIDSVPSNDEFFYCNDLKIRANPAYHVQFLRSAFEQQLLG